MPIVAPMVTICTSVWNKFDSQNEVFIICLFAKLQKRQKIPHVSFYFLPVYDFEQCSIRRNIQFTTLNGSSRNIKEPIEECFQFCNDSLFLLAPVILLDFRGIEVWAVISAWFQFRPLHLPTTEWWISLSTLFVAQVWTWINGLHSPILLERYLFKSSNIFEIFIFSANVRL